MTKADIIIKNGIVVTVNTNGTIYSNGSVVIINDAIIAIGESVAVEKEYTSDNVIDAKGKIVMPGLINCHTHLAMTIFRGYADDMHLKEWLNDYIFPAEAKFDNAENVKCGSELAMIEMIHSGTTTFNDMYFFEDEVAKVAKTIGMRGIISESLIDFPAPNSKTPDECFNHSKMLIEKYKNDSLITVGVAAHSPYSCSTELLKKAKKFADYNKINFHIHVAESKWEIDTINKKYNQTPIQYLNNIGVLSDNVIAAHGVWLNDDDISIVHEKGVAIAHNPVCNMKLSSGVAPITKLLNSKCKVGLGTDGVASNNNLNMFEDMKTMTLLAKLSTDNPTSITAEMAVRIATIEGAKVLNLDKEIGSLEVGKKADIILIDIEKPNTTPIYNIYSTLVYAVNGSDVTDVIINGKIIMQNSNILTADEKLVMKKINKIAENIALQFQRKG